MGRVRHVRLTFFPDGLMIDARFWGNLGELWGQSKVIFNKIPEDCVNLCFAFLGRTRIDPGVIRDHFQPVWEFSGTPTCHAGAVWAACPMKCASPSQKGFMSTRLRIVKIIKANQGNHLAAVRCHLVPGKSRHHATHERVEPIEHDVLGW